MSDRNKGTLTIGQVMLAIAGVALAVGLLAGRGAATSASVAIGLIGAVFLAVASAVATVDAALGIRCPRCGDWSMARTLVFSFRDRYFRCNACQVRCRRGFLTGWSDASGPEYDAFYARKRAENPWTAPPGLDDEDLIYSKTHGNLLANKQRRHPNPPDQDEGRSG